jgi:predicted ATPase
MSIPRIVLTGGPCGGKTTALEFLKTRLPQMGITPIFVPELATLMFQAGVKWTDVSASDTKAFKFQVAMILGQITNEDMIFSFASLPSASQKVIICDRGTIDNMVYSKDEWHTDILSQVGSLGFLKRRYDGIIHLDTLAYGSGYNTDNPARYETRDGAIAMDQRTWDTWAKGPSMFHERISHSVSLDEKMEQVASYVEFVVKHS